MSVPKVLVYLSITLIEFKYFLLVVVYAEYHLFLLAQFVLEIKEKHFKI